MMTEQALREACAGMYTLCYCIFICSLKVKSYTGTSHLPGKLLDKGYKACNIQYNLIISLVSTLKTSNASSH